MLIISIRVQSNKVHYLLVITIRSELILQSSLCSPFALYCPAATWVTCNCQKLSHKCFSARSKQLTRFNCDEMNSVPLITDYGILNNRQLYCVVPWMTVYGSTHDTIVILPQLSIGELVHNILLPRPWCQDVNVATKPSYPDDVLVAGLTP